MLPNSYGYSKNSYQKSMQDKIANSRPEDLMVMLYDGMITKIRQAQESFQAGHEKQAHEAAFRAMKIADALSDNLNRETGGETAKNLESLYEFIVAEIGAAIGPKAEVDRLKGILPVLETLRASWQKLAERAS